MNPAPIGTKIQVISNSNHHHYCLGGIYRVHKISSSNTFVAVDEQDIEGDALRWIDCAVIGLGWDWLRTQLDANSLDLLCAFDGLENLRMRQSVESRLISGIPNLGEAIRNKLPELEAVLLSGKQAAESAELQGLTMDDDEDAVMNSLFES